MYHIRDIIKSLNIKELIANKIIPPISFNNLENKKYPPIVYKKAKIDSAFYSKFGIFVEDLIHQTLVPEHSIQYKELLEEIPKKWTESIKSFIKESFDECEFIFETEINWKNITGHPDIVGSSYILEIKTTTNFRKMQDESLLQLLSYVAISRAVGNIVEYIGFCLPIQKQYIWMDVRGWDHSSFLTKLEEEAIDMHEGKLGSIGQFEMLNNGDVLYITRSGWIGVGGHISKDTDEYPDNVPFQIFIGNARSTEIPKTDDSEFLKTKCKSKEVYIHAPYTINLCNNKLLKLLIYQLEYGKKIGARGVVVHTGTHGDMTYDQGLSEMKKYLLQIADKIDPSCPLLLETPAGEGNDIVASFETMSSFYENFKDDKRFGLCVDTCHVFSSGVDPLRYMIQWERMFPKTIKLIHFNDSKNPKGACLDRHEFPGNGYIGLGKMTRIYTFAQHNNIPMVIE